MAQVRTSWPLTAEARFRCRVTLCEICGGQSSTGAVLRFAPVNIISPTLHTHLLLLADLNQKHKRTKPGYLPESNAIPEIG
jgi:hypothetical protein